MRDKVIHDYFGVNLEIVWAVVETRREREAARARSKYLGDLARREPAVWKEIHDLIATKKPASYAAR